MSIFTKSRTSASASVHPTRPMRGIVVAFVALAALILPAPAASAKPAGAKELVWQTTDPSRKVYSTDDPTRFLLVVGRDVFPYHVDSEFAAMETHVDRALGPRFVDVESSVGELIVRVDTDGR